MLTYDRTCRANKHIQRALDDNGVTCWGYNGEGQTDVPSLSNPVAVSAGNYHTCANLPHTNRTMTKMRFLSLSGYRNER